MAEAVLLTHRQDHTLILTLNRPDRLNAMNDELRDAIVDAFAGAADDDEIRAIVVTANGRGFCSGADVSAAPPELPTPTQSEMLDESGWVGRQARTVYGIDKPVIAAMNGVAAGAGMSLALAADIRIGSTAARFKTVFIERNLSPDSGMSFFLPRIVGYARAAELIFTSRTVEATEAFQMGLLNHVVEPGELLDRALETAAMMTRWPPVALRASKRVLQNNIEADLESALRYEMQGLSHGRKAKNDAIESRAAFVEKRHPTYTGT